MTLLAILIGLLVTLAVMVGGMTLLAWIESRYPDAYYRLINRCDLEQ